MTRPKTTILIVDDHTLLREAWSFALESDDRFKIVAHAGSGEEGVRLAQLHQPDVILMDISLPGISGLEATEQIRQKLPSAKVLCISAHSNTAYVRKMLKSGARGYVTKSSSRAEMVEAILEVQQGRIYLCREIKDHLTEQALTGKDGAQALKTLTRQELKIVELIRKGQTSKEIADQLKLSIKTVEVHRYNILKKLQMKNTTSLIDFLNRNAI